MCLLAHATEQSSNLYALINFLIKESDVEAFSSKFVPPVIVDTLALTEKIELAARTLKNQPPPLSQLCRVLGKSKDKVICSSNTVGFISNINRMIKTYGIDAHQTYIGYDQESNTFVVKNLDKLTLYSIKANF